MPLAQPKTNRPTVTLSPPKADLAGLSARYMNPGELDALIYLVASVKPRVVVEFGCNSGRTAVAILRNVPGIEHYLGIEVQAGHVPSLPAQCNEVPLVPGELALGDDRFYLLTMPRGSFDMARMPQMVADAVFIDADHSRAGVLNDYALAKTVTRRGGIIVFHDDNGLPEVQVSETLDELATGGAEIVHVAGTWLAFERIA